jgi:hypothetical protein
MVGLLRTALVAEVRKVRTTRLWWILLLAMAAYLGFIGAVLAFYVVSPPAGSPALTLSGPEAAAGIYGLVSSVGYVFPLVIGSLLITAEVRYRTLGQSLLAQPRRGLLLVAKLLVAVPLGVLYGVVGVLALVAGSAPLLAWKGDGSELDQRSVVAVLLLGVVVTAVWTVIGVAFGSLVTNQVAAIVVILAFTQFVEPIARLALASVDGLGSVARFLPGAAADGLIGTSLLGDFGRGSVDLLPRPAALVVLVLYAVVLAVLGRVTTLRRDVG